MAIQLITIDFWNTLFDSSNSDVRKQHRLETVKKEISSMGLNIDDTQLEKAGEECWRVFDVVWRNEHRTPDTKELIHVMLSYLDIEHDSALIERLTKQYAEGILHHPPALLPGVKEVIPLLASKYSLAIVSDTAFSPGKVLRKLLQLHSIDSYFTEYSFSDETGYSKPHPKAFSIVLDALGVEPERTVHCGDIERTDILGAKNYGIKAILYKGDVHGMMSRENPEQTRADAIAHTWHEIHTIVEQL